MNLKFIFLGFIFFWALISCTEKITDNPKTGTDGLKLKSASINYYVATTGNDANAGTLASPFKTIQKAANVAAPGDVVIVRDGTYTATSTNMITLNTSGTIGNVITFKAEHKGGVILDGASTYDTCFGFMAGVSYINISGFEIKNFKWFGFVLNNSDNPNTNIAIQDNHIHHIGRYDDPSEYGHCGIYQNKVSSILIERNLFNDIGRLAPNEGGTSTTYANHDQGIYISGGDGITILHNIFYNCNRGWGIQLFSSNYYPISNINIYNNTFDYGNPYKNGSHIIIADHVTNANIKNNLFGGSTACNYAIDVDVLYFTYSNIVITNNIVGGGGGAGAIVSGVKSGMAISGNLTNTDPKMVSPATLDFSLQSTSPAIKAGVNVGLTTDYFNNPIVGLPDIGAIQNTSGQVSPPPTVYYNAQTSATAVKSDCGTGYTGSTVTYTVAANKYSSTISQADADSKAAADLSTNKQTYANTNGTCTAITPTIYYNTQLSATATKNDCGTGYTGSTVTYTVAANKYSSTISQADADNKAATDLSTNTQAFANANGTCTAVPQTIYYNVQMSATATKNSCGKGYKGSTVTYTVSANKYSSTISQADANNQAIADLNNNKQGYANTYGTCTRIKWWNR